MYVYVYVSLLCSPIHMHAHTHRHRHTHTHTHTNTHWDTNTHRHTHKHRQTDRQTDWHTHIHKHTHTHKHTYTHSDTHTHTHTHTHKHTHTHTHKHTHTPGGHTTKKSGLVRSPQQLLYGMVLLPQVIVDLLSEVQILLLLWWQLKIRWLFLQLPVAEHVLSRLIQNVCSYVCVNKTCLLLSKCGKVRMDKDWAKMGGGSRCNPD